MSCPQQFSEVTKRYLCCFYEILDEMIDGMTKAQLTDSISHNFIAVSYTQLRPSLQPASSRLAASRARPCSGRG